MATAIQKRFIQPSPSTSRYLCTTLFVYIKRQRRVHACHHSFPKESNNSAMEYLQSQKNGNMLIHDGYRYRRDKKHMHSVTWRCTTPICKGRLITKDGNATPTSSHNHGPDYGKNGAYAVRSEMRKLARTSDERPRSIIQQCSRNVSVEVAVSLPTYHAARQIIHRERKKGISSVTYSSLAELELSEESTRTSRGDKFLLWDSGREDNDRIIVFGTNSNLTLLKEFTNWCADGTFKVSPTLFLQLYTIHALIDSKAIPLIFALLRNKKKETYVRMLKKLTELAPSINPHTILIDFELAAVNAFSEVFSDVTLVGCYFHLSQNLWRQIQKIKV